MKNSKTSTKKLVKKLIVYSTMFVIGGTTLYIGKYAHNKSTRKNVLNSTKEKIGAIDLTDERTVAEILKEEYSANISDEVVNIINDTPIKEVIEMTSGNEVDYYKLTNYAQILEENSLKLYKQKVSEATNNTEMDTIKFFPTYFDRSDYSIGCENGYCTEVNGKVYNLEDKTLDKFLLNRAGLIGNTRGYTYEEVLNCATPKEQEAFATDCYQVATDMLLAASLDYSSYKDSTILTDLSFNTNDFGLKNTIAIKIK